MEGTKWGPWLAWAWGLGLLGAVVAAEAAPIGEVAAVQDHLDQAGIEAGWVTFRDILEHGGLVFNARFNALDGQGRPGTTGGGAPRAPTQPHTIRTSGPDATSCTGCHAQPFPGGAGDFVANVFVLAQTLDPVTFSVDAQFSNERNTLGMHGAGAIEMLAREMTAELHRARDAALSAAAASAQPVRVRLTAKGVGFGFVTALPDGRLDPTEIEGVDWDLIIKPFHQKGAVISIREFTNNALNHHHGMQTTERFGLGTDPDGDGIADELTVGDVTAATLWQAALGNPTRVWPEDRDRRRAARQGERLFGEIGCGGCHVPAMTLAARTFTEPNPYNPPGNLRPEDVTRPVSFDLTREGDAPHLRPAGPRGALVAAFTDLKRHDLNDSDYDHFANEQVPQGMINGFAPAASFTVAPYPRPTREFLTRKLWDVGNTDPYGHRGDLSTLTEAIYFHGGEARVQRDRFFALAPGEQAAVIEFLKTLQVVGPNSGELPIPHGLAFQ
ncbi:MAG: di-heme oxidoredictase family protein [Pseudomonadota bacterium]|jgi:hypothetical protein